MIRAPKPSVNYQLVETVLIKFLLPIMLLAIPAVSGYFSYRASVDASASKTESIAAKVDAQKNSKQIDVVQEKLDGRLSEMLDLTRKNSRAEGVAEGEKNEKDKGGEGP